MKSFYRFYGDNVKGYIVTKKTGIKIRMVKVILPDGEIEVLLTNLYDDKIFTVTKLKDLYFMRWKIETSYGKQKNQLQIEICSGHKVICIEQDYGAGLFVANLQSIIEKQCELEIKKISATRVHDYKINRNISWASLKILGRTKVHPYKMKPNLRFYKRQVPLGTTDFVTMDFSPLHKYIDEPS